MLPRKTGISKSWIYRFTMVGRTRDAGLGACRDVSLAAARDAAQRCRQLVAAGVDPIEHRKAESAAAKRAAATAIFMLSRHATASGEGHG